MNKLALISFLEDSFLRPLLLINTITDISYNGAYIYCQDNEKGRYKTDINVSNNDIYDFIRQIANLSEKQFSYSCPFLDISFSRYRISALHHSLAKYDENGVVTFSLRITNNRNHIENDYFFIDQDTRNLITLFLKKNISIIISGLPSSGKTELQKFLISLFDDNKRVIVIDNINELSLVNNSKIDLNIWNYKEDISSLDNLIKQALRSNPDWLIIAESRGKEMASLLNSVMTGVPLITTIHSLDNKGAPNRMARMIMQNRDNVSYEEILNDIFYYFACYIHIKKTSDKNNKIIRYINEITLINEKGIALNIFEFNGSKKIYTPLSIEFIKKYEIDKKSISKSPYLSK